MKLKIRYENEVQVLDLNREETEELWVSLSIEGEPESEEEKEKLIQDAFDTGYNKPDYNNWHKFNRHRGYSKARPGEDEGDEYAGDEPLMSEVADEQIFCRDELSRREREEYDDVCRTVREACGSKVAWADMFIAIRIDGMSVNEYAAQIGANPSNISHKLERATQKIKKFLENRQI